MSFAAGSGFAGDAGGATFALNQCSRIILSADSRSGAGHFVHQLQDPIEVHLQFVEHVPPSSWSRSTRANVLQAACAWARGRGASSETSESSSQQSSFENPASPEGLYGASSDRLSSGRQGERAARQFCRQVQRALNLALADRQRRRWHQRSIRREDTVKSLQRESVQSPQSWK